MSSRLVYGILFSYFGRQNLEKKKKIAQNIVGGLAADMVVYMDFLLDILRFYFYVISLYSVVIFIEMIMWRLCICVCVVAYRASPAVQTL